MLDRFSDIHSYEKDIIDFFVLYDYCLCWGSASACSCYSTEFHLNSLSSSSAARSGMYGFDNSVSEVEGSPYLYDSWMPGKVVLMNGAADDVYLKYDVLNQQLEVRMNEYSEVKVGNDMQIKSFTLSEDFGKEFITLFGNQVEEKRLSGFAEVYHADTVSLLKHHYIIVKKPDYKVGLDVGSKNFKLITQDDFYLLHGKTLSKVSMDSFGMHEKKVKSYMRKNKLRIKNETDLVDIVKYYNTLIK